MPHFSGKKIILASKSPRRQQLLRGLDIDFEIRTKEVNEVYPHDLEMKKIPVFLAELKAAAFLNTMAKNEILITSDTIVILGNSILEKPTSREKAVEMIRRLSGKTHTVLTGVCIQSLKKKEMFTDSTEVTFCELSDEEITYYVDTYKPFDKAGSYGAQEWLGYIGIESMNGSYFNVMGLPLHRVYRVLKSF